MPRRPSTNASEWRLRHWKNELSFHPFQQARMTRKSFLAVIYQKRSSPARRVTEGGLGFVVFGDEVEIGEAGEAEVFLGAQGF